MSQIISPRPRLIPLLLLKHGVIVKPIFSTHQVIGNPMSTIERYSSWNIDELIVLDISKGEDFHDLRRDDLQQNYFGDTIYDVLKEICFSMFYAFNIWWTIQNLKHIEKRLNAGADKVTINTIAFKDKNFVHEAVKTFGSQCIVASIDVKKFRNKKWQVYINGGQENTCLESLEWAYQLTRYGCW